MEFLNKIKNFFTRILNFLKPETSQFDDEYTRIEAFDFRPIKTANRGKISQEGSPASKAFSETFSKKLEEVVSQKIKSREIEEIGHDVLLGWLAENKIK